MGKRGALIWADLRRFNRISRYEKIGAGGCLYGHRALFRSGDTDLLNGIIGATIT